MLAHAVCSALDCPVQSALLEYSRGVVLCKVLEDNAFDRMHSLVYSAAVSGTNGASNTDLSASLSQQRQQPMEHDAELPPLEAPATAREHSQHEQQQIQDLKRHKRSQQVLTIQQSQADSRWVTSWNVFLTQGHAFAILTADKPR